MILSIKKQLKHHLDNSKWYTYIRNDKVLCSISFDDGSSIKQGVSLQS